MPDASAKRSRGRRIALALVRLRHVIVAFWIAAAVAAVALLPSIADQESGGLTDLVSTNGQAVEAEVRANELFSFPLLSRTVVVQRDPGGLSPAAHARVVERVARINRGQIPRLRNVLFALAMGNVFGRPPFSRESSTTALTYLFFSPEIGREGRTGLAQLFADRFIPPRDDVVGVTGAVPARSAQVEIVRDRLPLVEGATLLMVLAIMALFFRAPGPPLVNLLAIAVTYVLAVRLSAGIGEAVGIFIPPEVEPVMVALLFGIVTDYTIFYVARFRSGLRDGASGGEAVIDAITETGPIIWAAALTVAAATASLAAATLGFYESFGPGLALAVVVALLVTTTLVPAALAIAGERLLWPWGARESSPGSVRERLRAARKRVIELPVRRPAGVVIATFVLLVALSVPLAGLRVGNPVIESLPADSEPRRAYRAAVQGFAAGILSPTVVIVEGPQLQERPQALAAVQEELAADPDVAAVIGPSQVGPPVELGAVYSPTGEAVRYFVVLDADPLGARAIDIVHRLEDTVAAALDRHGLGEARASFAGDTALAAETASKTTEDLRLVVPVAIAALLLILAVYLRALVAPLLLLLSSLLAVTASLGLAVLLFQELLGYREIAFYVPFAAAVLLVALGSDYNVYLAGRVWREGRRRALSEAVRAGASRSAEAIAVAAVVLAASFALLAIIPLASFRQLAFTVSAGLLIDAFVVRTLLAPALIVLAGERSGWPWTRFGLRRRGG